MYLGKSHFLRNLAPSTPQNKWYTATLKRTTAPVHKLLHTPVFTTPGQPFWSAELGGRPQGGPTTPCDFSEYFLSFASSSFLRQFASSPGGGICHSWWLGLGGGGGFKHTPSPAPQGNPPPLPGTLPDGQEAQLARLGSGGQPQFLTAFRYPCSGGCGTGNGQRGPLHRHRLPRVSRPL